MRFIFGLLVATLLLSIGCQIKESAPSPRGMLYVATSDSLGVPQPGAKIYLNGVPQSQTTPAIIGPLAVGTYTMTLQLRRFEVDTEQVTVYAGDTTHANEMLKLARTGVITVSSDPNGARVLLNEEFLTDNAGQIYTTPCSFTASVGNEFVSVVLSGYRTVNPSLLQVNVTLGDTIPVSFSLEQATVGQSIGNLIPEYTLRLIGPDSTQFDSLNLNQYRGHLTVYTCWFTICIPCKQELPFFDLFYREFAPQGVRFVALTTPQPSHEPYNSWLQAIHEVGISFPVLVDTNHRFWSNVVPPSYNAFPENIVVDSTGVILMNAGQVSEDELRAMITSHLP